MYMSLERIYEIKKQWIPVYALLLAVALVVTIYLILVYMYTQNEDFLMYTMLSLLFSLYMGFNLVKLIRIKVPKYSYVKVLKCSQCDHTITVPMKKSDYLFKEEGTCPKCGSKMYIIALYKEEVRRS